MLAGSGTHRNAMSSESGSVAHPAESHSSTGMRVRYSIRKREVCLREAGRGEVTKCAGGCKLE